MADLKNLMLEELRKSSLIQTSSIDETEEFLDTGLEKNEDNILAAALAYLDNKGYRRRADNIDFAKNMIMESSEGYDTVIIKQKRVVETDLFEGVQAEKNCRMQWMYVSLKPLPQSIQNWNVWQTASTNMQLNS